MKSNRPVSWSRKRGPMARSISAKKKNNVTFKKKRQPRKTLFKKEKTSPSTRKKTPSPPKKPSQTKKKLKENFILKMEKIFKGDVKELSSKKLKNKPELSSRKKQ